MSTKSVGRPKEGNPEETRRAILNAAIDNFAQDGFVGATTRNVAQQAGVNVATLHYHFGSKEGLYKAAWAEAAKGELPQTASQDSDRQTIDSALDLVLDFTAQRPSLSRLSLYGLLDNEEEDGDEPQDPRIQALTSALRSINGFEVGTAENMARWFVALVDATALASERPRPADGASEIETEALLRPRQTRAFLKSAAVTLAGLGAGLQPESGR